jgi:hypothetical protein
LAPAYSRAVQKQCPVLARRGAERVLVTTAEMGEISKAAGKRVCGGLHFSTVRSDNQIVRRTRDRIRRAREEVMLMRPKNSSQNGS